MANTRSEHTSVSESVGDYLKAMWILGGTEPVSTRDLAEHLCISAPSVSGMLVRLHETGLINHERYHGAALTSRGRSEALRLVRRHRLIETLLVKLLNYSWEEVHDEAEILEHAVSDRFIEQLDDLLGNPTHDPHGDPIPAADGSVPATPDVLLAEAGAGTTFSISRLGTQDSEQLAYLARLGLRPAKRILVEANQEESGSLHINIDGCNENLPRELAELIEGEIIK